MTTGRTGAATSLTSATHNYAECEPKFSPLCPLLDICDFIMPNRAKIVKRLRPPPHLELRTLPKRSKNPQ